jgi:hypothetical protein
MQRELENALAELALGPEIAADDARGIDAWLARHALPEADAAALRRDFGKLRIYRTLVRNNLREALHATMPRAMARLGERFETDFAALLASSPPDSHSLRELTPQFLRFVLPRWAEDPSVPDYLADLARHEALQVEVASLEARPRDHVQAELALDEGVAFVDAVRLVRYDWAVHRLSEDEADRALPERDAVRLLVYRSPEHEVRYLELGAFAAALLAGLIDERLALRTALGHAAEQIGQPLSDDLLQRAARLLSDLAERGALLGKAPPTEKSANLLPNSDNPA